MMEVEPPYRILPVDHAEVNAGRTVVGSLDVLWRLKDKLEKLQQRHARSSALKARVRDAARKRMRGKLKRKQAAEKQSRRRNRA